MSVRLSLVWTYLAQALSFIVAFSSSIVVARLVSPRDFGIFGMATAITAILNIFMSFGLAKYIIREKEADRDLLRSLFTINCLLTLGYVVVILGGALIAVALASPEVAQVLLIFALFPLIAMFEFIPGALCAREGRFGLISGIAVLRAVVISGMTVMLAFTGFAYLSFAWATVAAAIATAIAFNIACFRPDAWKPRLAGFRTIFRFGADMVGIGGFSQLSTRFGEMGLGSLLGLTSLGLYTRASSLPMTLFSSIHGAGVNVIFSRMSQEMRDTGTFHETYVRFMRLTLGLFWPMMLGIAVIAHPLVFILYGAKWLGAAVPLALLMLAFAVSLAVGMTSEVFILRDQTRRQVKIESVRAGTGLALFIGGALISLPAAAAAKLAESLLAFVMYRRPMNSLIGGSPHQLRSVYRESLLLGLAAIAPAALLMTLNDWSPTVSIPMLLGSIGAGGILWGGVLTITGHPLSAEAVRLWHLVRARWS